MTNITVATFAEGVKVVQTEPLHQYDYGQILRFVGIDDAMDSSNNYEVHFSNNDLSGSAKSVVGGSDGVIIPDEYLASGADVHAWVYTHTGASDEDEEYTDGRTSYEVIIPVLKRARPSDLPPTPTGRDTIVGEIQELQGDVHDINESIDGITGDIDDLTPRVSTLEGTATNLTGRVSTLETKTAYSQTTATLGGQAIGIRKQGRVVTVELGSLTPNPAIAAQGETVYQNVIPSGYRPATGAIFLVMSSASAVGGNMVQVTFTTTGHVGFYNWSTGAIGPTTGWVRGTFTYFCAE